jgi:hypothetical protein
VSPGTSILVEHTFYSDIISSEIYSVKVLALGSVKLNDVEKEYEVFQQERITSHTSRPWLRRLAVGLLPRRPGFYPGSVHVGFVVDKWHWDRFFPY